MIQVETMTAGFQRRLWPAESLEVAENIARRISTNPDPQYANAVFVIDGIKPITKFDRGIRLPL